MSKSVVFIICIKNINNINCKYCKQYCGRNKNNLSEKPHRHRALTLFNPIRVYCGGKNQLKLTLIFPQLQQ